MGATAGLMALQGVSTYGTIAGDEAQAKAVRRQSAFTQQQAALMEKDAVDRGQIAGFQRGAETRQQIGAERAGMGAEGLDLGTGSAADVQAHTARLGALDRATIQNNAAREAWGYRVQADVNAAAAANEVAGLRTDEANALVAGITKTYGIYRNRKTTPAPTGNGTK